MRRFHSVLAGLLLFSYMLQAQSTDLFDKLLYISKKDTLPYRLLKPVNPSVQEVFPLVIFLHGAGERGNDNIAQLKHITDLFLNSKYRGKYPCYVAAPQCPKNKMWVDRNHDGTSSHDPATPVQLVMELIDNIGREFPIDTSRIYITGVSMGGYGTWHLLASYPDKFAAAVPICGGGNEQAATRIKHIPLWAFHGAKDTVVAPSQSRKMIKALRNAGGFPGYTEYPNIEHNSWVQAYQEPHLMPWLFKQKLKSGGSY